MQVKQITAKVAEAIAPTKTVAGALKPHLKMIDDLQAVVTQRENMIRSADIRMAILREQINDLEKCVKLHNEEIDEAKRLVNSLQETLS